MRWLHALLPKEERFFALFDAHAAVLVRAAEALEGMLEGGATVVQHAQSVIDLEHEADAITREVLIAVRRTFITPFDRRDIVDLISSMDDAVDQMQQTAKAIQLYDVDVFSPEMRRVGSCILQCAALVKEAVPLLNRINAEAARLNALCERIVQIEGEADGLHEEGLRTACCMEVGEAKEAPSPGVAQALRTEFGRPRSSMRLRTSTAMATSVACPLRL